MATTHQQQLSSSRAQFSYDEQRVPRQQQVVQRPSDTTVDLTDPTVMSAVASAQQIAASRGGANSFQSGESTSSLQRRSQLQYGRNGGPEVARGPSSIKSEPHEADNKNCLNGSDVARVSVSSSEIAQSRSSSGTCSGSKLMTSSSTSTSMISTGTCRDSAAATVMHNSDVMARHHQQIQQQPEIGMNVAGGNCSFSVSSLVHSGSDFNGSSVTSLTGDTVSTVGHQLDMAANALNPHYHAAAAASAVDRPDLSSLTSCLDPSSAAQWFASTGGQHVGGGCYSSTTSNRMPPSATSTPDFYVHRLHQTMSVPGADRPMSDGSPSSASSGYAPPHQTTGYPTSSWYASGNVGPEASYGLSPTAGMFHDVFGDVTSAASRMLSAQQYMAAAAAAAAARQSCSGSGGNSTMMQATPAAFRSYYGCATPGGVVGPGVIAGGGYQPYAGEDCSAKY